MSKCKETLLDLNTAVRHLASAQLRAEKNEKEIEYLRRTVDNTSEKRENALRAEVTLLWDLLARCSQALRDGGPQASDKVADVIDDFLARQRETA